jgi:acyl-CoA dehydrogenase
LEESGFGLAAAPEALGGAGANWADLCGVVRLCGRYALPLPLPETMLVNWLLGACGQPALAGPLSFSASGGLTLAAGKVSGVAADVPWGRNVPFLVAIAAGEVPTLVLLPVEGASAHTLRSNTAGEARDEFVYESAVPLLAVPLPASLPPTY